MGKITDFDQSRRLKEFGINIKTKYRTQKGVQERNSDGSHNDNIESGIRIEKQYYKNGAVVYKTNDFDSRILYSFVADAAEKEEFTCPNCGAICKMTEAEKGCPYCGAFWNLDYSHKDLGTKYTYDRTMKNNHYVWITLLVDFIFSLLAAWIFIAVTGRTFNIYDMAKVLIFGIIWCAAFFYVFYYLDALILLWPIKYYKDICNQKQIEFWKRMEAKDIRKDKFYNNFNYEISQFYFAEQKEVIDYDILDYNKLQEVEENGKLKVLVNATIRIVKYRKLKIQEKIEKKDFLLEYQGPTNIHLKGGLNQMTCKSCGSSIDITLERCPYCNAKCESLQEWLLIN